MKNFLSKLTGLHRRKNPAEVLRQVQIPRAGNNQMVDAQVIKLTGELAEEMIDGVWWQDAGLLENNKREGDQHWLWKNIANDYGKDNLHECIAILSEEQYLEGAIAYYLGAKSVLEPGKGSIYVGWLATAPRNRNWLTNTPFYKAVGTMLLYLAVVESYQVGLEGRILLESLPVANTLRFYENKEFVRTNTVQTNSSLIEYELPKTAALAWLRKNGDLP